jgi:hypothetical protein
MTGRASAGTGYREPLAFGTDDDGDEGVYGGGGRAVQRERGTARPHPGDAPAGDAQRTREAQVGAPWRDGGPMRGVYDAIPRP